MKLSKKIKCNVKYILSLFDRKNKLHIVRRFAEKNGACNGQYKNLIELMIYHSESECWEFILGNYMWLAHRGFHLYHEDIDIDFVKAKAFFRSKTYYSNLTIASVSLYNIDTGNKCSELLYDLKSRLEGKNDYDCNNTLTNSYRYIYHGMYGMPVLYCHTSLIGNDVYVETFRDYNGLKTFEKTMDKSFNKNGKFVKYFSNSEQKSEEGNYKNNRLDGMGYSYNKDGTVERSFLYEDGNFIEEWSTYVK